MPEIDVYVGDRVASAYIDELNLDICVDATLIFPDIESNVRAVNVCNE